MRNRRLAKRIIITIAALLLVSFCLSGCKPGADYYELDSVEVTRKYTVDKRDTYLGHPDSVLLANGSILAAYPEGHGKGSIVLRISSDYGITWSAPLKTPESFKDSQETPTLYPLEFSDGTIRYILIAGRPGWGDTGEGFESSVSTNGTDWTEFRRFYDGFKAIVAMSSLTRIKENGVFVDKWMGTFHDYDFVNYKTYLTFDENGLEQWSYPERLFKEHRQIEKDTAMCELETLRSPDGNELMMIARANNRVSNSLVTVSADEGLTWSEPKELPAVLTGDRHKAEYDPVTGKLFITFRGIWYKGGVKKERRAVADSWVGWIGDYSDIKSYVNNDSSDDMPGDKRVVIAKDYYKGDCGYGGVVINSYGEISVISYGYFERKVKNPYIMSAVFTINELLG